MYKTSILGVKLKVKAVPNRISSPAKGNTVIAESTSDAVTIWTINYAALQVTKGQGLENGRTDGAVIHPCPTITLV